MRRSLIGSLVLAISLTASADSSKINWRPWDEALFQEAKVQKKLVILDLQAVWCHWCHVMETTTYADPKVIAVLNQSYIAVQADQDANPSLSRTYEDYGWPATIIFDSEGHELLKKAGYVSPERLAEVLKELALHPEPLAPEPATQSASLPPTALEKKLRQSIDESYDSAVGGWKGSHKYLDRDFVLDQLALSARGDKRAKKRAKQTLAGVRKINDPVWGGIYQYSVGGNWNEPHYEKLTIYQADALVTFATAYSYLGDAKDLATARKLQSYATRFLTGKDGAFYTSQDADLIPGEQSDSYFRFSDSARTAKGIPRVDQHVYARENGAMIEALVKLYEATGEKATLDQAERATDAIIKTHLLPSGGFKHAEDSTGDLSLGDQLAMGRAFLALYEATGDRDDLSRAQIIAHFISQTFATTAGYNSFQSVKAKVVAPKPSPEENISLARFANLLFHYNGQAEDRKMAEQAYEFAAHSEATERPYLLSALLLAQHELASDPLHLTIVGAKGNAQALALHKSALSYPSTVKRVEWLDQTEGPLPNADVSFPTLGKPVAFICTGLVCSTPMSDPAALRAHIDRLLRP